MLVAEWWKPDCFAWLTCFNVKFQPSELKSALLRSSDLPATSRTQPDALRKHSWQLDHPPLLQICGKFQCRNLIFLFFFLQSSITVIHYRSRTETRHLFLNNLNHLHPFRAKMFQDVELKQSRANKQTSTPLGSVTAGLVTRMTGLC